MENKNNQVNYNKKGTSEEVSENIIKVFQS